MGRTMHKSAVSILLITLCTLFFGHIDASFGGREPTTVYVLTRTSKRPRFFHFARASAAMQSNVAIKQIVSVDDTTTHQYVLNESRHGDSSEDATKRTNQAPPVHILTFARNDSSRFGHNLYMNALMQETVRLGPGWVMVLDDDNVFDQHDSVARLVGISEGDTDALLIGRVLIGSRVVPSELALPFRLGDIDMCCFAFHNSWVGAAEFDNNWGADFRFLQKLATSMKRVKWLNEIVARTQWTARSWNLSGKRVDRNW